MKKGGLSCWVNLMVTKENGFLVGGVDPAPYNLDILGTLQIL